MATPSAVPVGPRIAVVTVSYGSEDVLPAFLGSLSAASAHRLLVIVADNKADESLKPLVAEYGARHLPMPKNLGYGGAINAAVATLPESIQWILVSNPDLVISPGSVDVLEAAGEEDQRIGSVGPVTMTPDGQVYPSARTVPSLRTGVGHALFANFWRGNPWTKAYRNDSSAPPHRRDAGWLSGSCVLVRRSAFAEVGGFDPEFFMYFEDVDLGYRLGKHGYRNVYEPEAQVTHTGAHSTTSDSHRMIAAHHESARRFLNKKYSGAALWPVRAALTIGLNVRSALMRRKGNHS
ncbi:MAG: glycosyltransferase family 2 protein [Mycetocola sp.]|nr:glycosyltransferase family 2 protein [Mycetocola sp.]